MPTIQPWSMFSLRGFSVIYKTNYLSDKILTSKKKQQQKIKKKNKSEYVVNPN